MSVLDLGAGAPGRSLDPTTRGVLAMLAAMACFSGNDTLVKLTVDRLPASEIMTVRGIVGSGLLLGLILAMKRAEDLRYLRQPLVLLRALVEVGIAATFMAAVARLALAEITTLLQATPIILTALSALLLRQRISWRAWLAVLVGFGGVLLVVRPSSAGFSLEAGIALLSATLVAVRDLMTRFLPQETPSLVVTLAATMSVPLAGAFLGATAPQTWVLPEAIDLARLAGAATLVVSGNLAIVVACRAGDMTVIGPFRYSVILWSLLMGAAVWGDTLDLLGFAGAALIAASGLYTLFYERRRGRTACATA